MRLCVGAGIGVGRTGLVRCCIGSPGGDRTKPKGAQAAGVASPSNDGRWGWARAKVGTAKGGAATDRPRVAATAILTRRGMASSGCSGRYSACRLRRNCGAAF